MALAAAWVAIAATALAASSCHRVPRTAPGTERTPTAAAPSPFPAPSPAPPPPRGRVVSVVYSSNLLGRYENCGCPVHPLGGVARRATQVDRARAESNALLVVDAGDLLTTEAPAARAPPGDRAAPSASEIERRARLLAAAFARTGTSALLPGERDLAIGLPLLRRIARDARLPLVASNLYDASGKLLFDPDRVVDGAGLRVKIFGVAAPPTAGDAYAFRAAGIDARDPVAAARAEVASLRGRGARVIVALVHVGAMEHPPADIGSDGNPSSFQRCAAIRARPLSSSMRMSGPCSKRFACVWKPISTTSRMSPFGFRAEVNRTSIENDG